MSLTTAKGARKPPTVVVEPQRPGLGEAAGGARSSARAVRQGSGRGCDAEAARTAVPSERVIVDADMLPGKPFEGSLKAYDRQSSSASLAKLQRRLWLDRWASGIIAGIVLASTIAICILVFVRNLLSGTHDGLTSVLASEDLHYCVVTIVAAIAVTTIVTLGCSRHFQIVAACILCVWLQMVCRSAHTLVLTTSTYEFIQVAHLVSSGMAQMLACASIKYRIDALQRSEVRRTSCLTISLQVLVATTVLFISSVLFCHFGYGTCAIAHLDPGQWHWHLPLLVTLSMLGCSYLAFACISSYAFFRAWRVAAGVAAVARGRLKDDARQAQRTTFSQLLGTCTSFLATIFSVGGLIALRVMELHKSIPSFKGLLEWEHAFILVDALANILLALALAGVFSGSLIGTFVKERLEMKRRSLHSSTVATTTLSDNPEWNSTLEQLAGRGFTIQALLDFYKGLGKDYMLHYDSKRHTTLDVARRAIIPLSSERGVAYATIMMGGKPTIPENMVTHGWENLFRDLTAAIMSDALGESEYAMVAHMLEHNIESLERWIYAMGKQSSTYWVCAFSVNQHATICGENYGDRSDSVTGELHPKCCCSHEKILNESAPLFNGKSIHCELNKFDDFMALMALSSPSFQQVVAVDMHFTLFSRAWCVAELAVAARMGMHQKVKVHSRASLERCSHRLRNLRIEAMHASREEDKAEILSKIPDKEEFNKELRSLLVDRLFPNWHILDRTDQLLRMSNLGHWYTVSKMKSLDNIWEACTSQVFL